MNTRAAIEWILVQESGDLLIGRNRRRSRRKIHAGAVGEVEVDHGSLSVWIRNRESGIDRAIDLCINSAGGNER